MNIEEKISIKDEIQSIDKTARKYIQETYDRHYIETTFVDYMNKYIICFSTQIGCNLGCKFCYNGVRHNYIRNLTYSEICDQIENVLNKENIKKNKPILFSAMGIGEPLLNYDNLIKAFLYLNDKYPDSKFALATTGINLNNIMRLGEDLKDVKNFKLTISLHCANQERRKFLMPTCVDNQELVNVVKEYENKYSRKTEWNVVLLKDINDSSMDAKELFELLGKDEFIKLNKYNRIEDSEFLISDKIENFISILKNYGMQVEYYETNGEDINAACGQMMSK